MLNKMNQSQIQARQFDSPGKKHFTINSNGIKREFFVHVPPGYDPANCTPLVFMLHGHGSSGEEFYDKPGWVDVGNAENILTVFPSSWHYTIFDNGVWKEHARVWNAYGTEFAPGETPLDDVEFFRQIIYEMQQRYNIDAHRIYKVGFSNGGRMAARCAIELSDRLAAVVASSGSLPADARLTPNRLLPVMHQFGTDEPDRLKILGATESLPMDFAQLFSQYPQIQPQINAYINSFALQPTYTVSGNPAEILVATYQGLSGSPDNFFNFGLIKGMGHTYRGEIAHVNWQWMKNISFLKYCRQRDAGHGLYR
jgi:poly(3-hydroxybutyrate) depolymerase